ncbi:MAG TPA: TonB-dependent receptor [Lutibacter sp.]|nr:TonB-dependent receptor [Lutibacter sp.]
MKAGIINILFIVFFGQILFAQDPYVEQLDEVQVYSHFSPNTQVGYSIIILSDSLLRSRNDNLTQLLKRHTNTYIKEAGSGMVASISLRGSAASHTAVYWNGIPINSSLNGQTDFNTIFSSTYNKISIRKGGGSVLLGSGAIGGAINLENELEFSNTTQGWVYGSFGSFQTASSAIKVKHASKKSVVEVHYNTLSSKNNYSYYDSEITNENGEINQYAFQLNTTFKLDNRNKIYLKTQYNNSNRNTSRTLFSSSNANLSYVTHTALLGWKNKKNNYQSELKTAFVKEDYTYIFDKKTPNFISKNGSDKWYSNYDISYRLTDKLKLQSGVNYEMVLGSGSAIVNSSRKKIAWYSSLHHSVSEKVSYNVNMRKDWSSAYKIPLVFSIDSKQKWHKNHMTKVNFSTNYRTPTINDLYWESAGNPSLKPEKNWSAEIGYQWKFNAIKKLQSTLGITIFNSQSTDLIQWKPETNQFWKPVNIQDVTSKGLEFSLVNSLQKKNFSLSSNMQYSYTLSEDNLLKKQLIYVPKHMGALLLSISSQNWVFDFDEVYNGRVFTTSSNSNSIASYWLSNLSLKRYFKNKIFNLAVEVNNLFNTNYEIKLNRPMPQRNYSINFNYKF